MTHPEPGRAERGIESREFAPSRDPPIAGSAGTFSLPSPTRRCLTRARDTRSRIGLSWSQRSDGPRTARNDGSALAWARRTVCSSDLGGDVLSPCRRSRSTPNVQLGCPISASRYHAADCPRTPARLRCRGDHGDHAERSRIGPRSSPSPALRGHAVDCHGPRRSLHVVNQTEPGIAQQAVRRQPVAE